MEKKIEDYLHLYFGCEVEIIKVDEQLTHYMDSCWFGRNKGDILNLSPIIYMCVLDKIVEIKPILRQLSDRTMAERDEYYKIKGIRSTYTTDFFHVCEDARAIKFLLSKGFDLFGLIEAGLAIDKTKTN